MPMTDESTMAVQPRHQIYHQAGFEEVAKPLQHRGGYERDQMKQVSPALRMIIIITTTQIRRGSFQISIINNVSDEL